MIKKYRAHFDGEKIILDEPTDLVPGQEVRVRMIGEPEKYCERIANGLKKLDLSHLVGREITGIEFPCQVQINLQFGGEDILYCMGKIVHEWNGMDRVILDWRLVDIQVLARIWDCKIEAWGKTEDQFYLDFEGWGRLKCIPLPTHGESFGIQPANLWF